VQLTKFGHSCVRFDDGDRTLVIDPGAFSEVAAALDGVDAVLITHEHADHVDADKVRDAVRADPRLRVWAPQPVVAALDVGDQAVAVGPGESFDAAGFRVRTYGGQHAVIHPTIPIVANVGYLVDDAVFHPGDSLVVPPASVRVLLLPSVAVRAPRVYPIHDAIASDLFRAVVQRNLTPIAAPFGIDYAAWDGPITV
jgi:L-ascorbate metabolism protein UlaG (beta-lactamase superfamily)